MNFQPLPEPHCTADRHHTRQAYQDGCRCGSAREAERIYRKRLRYGLQPPALVPALGVTRRLQALTALGHRTDDLARWCRMSLTQLNAIRNGSVRMVKRRTRERVCVVYERMSMIPGSCQRARAYAEAQGWAPPLAWDDDKLDDPLGQPYRPGRPRRHPVQPRGAREDIQAYKERVKAGWLAGDRDDVIAARENRSIEAIRRLRYRNGWVDRAAALKAA